MANEVIMDNITGINQVGNSYQRKSAVPLDYYSFFNTKEAAENYAASNPVAYVGQYLAYTDEDKIVTCVIDIDSSLKELGDSDVIQAINDELNKIISGSVRAREAYYARYYTDRNGSHLDYGLAEAFEGKVDKGVLETNYATKNYVLAEIAKAQLEGDDIDLSGYATKDEIKDFITADDIPAVNNATLTIKKNGTSIGTFTANSSTNKEIDIEIPAAPTVGDGILTIQKNGTAIGTFSANATSAKTINITVPSAIEDLSNGGDVAFQSDLTSIRQTAENAATKADGLETRLDGIVAQGGEPNTINTIKVNGTAQAIDASKAVNITVPTKIRELDDGDELANALNTTSEQIGELNGLLWGCEPYHERLIYKAYYARYYTEISGVIDGSKPMPTIAEAIGGKLDRYGWSNDHVNKVLVIKPGGTIEPGNPTIEGAVDAAGKWSSSLTLSLFGDATGSVTFDGSEGSVVLDTSIPGDIIRGTYMPFEVSGAFILEGTNTTITEGRADKLYLDTTNNKFYLWSSDHFAEFEISGNNSGEGESVNLDNYYTIDKTCSAINAALSNYYTSETTRKHVTDALLNYVKTADLEDYATKVWVNQELAKVSTGGTVDLSNYFTKTETNSAIAAALTSIEELQSNNEYLKVADNDGRVIMEVDKDGLYTSNIYLPNISLADRAIEWDDKSKVTWTQKTTSGTKIATININGTNTDIYAPSGGTGGSSTDEKVKQVSDTSATGNYPLLFKNSTGNSTTTDSAKFNPNIYVQPTSGKLYGRLIYSECYYASNGTKLDDIYATKTEAVASGKTVSIQAVGASASANNKFKIPYSNATADTGYTGELNQSDKFAFNPATYALTIGNYTNPWEKTFITNEGLTIERYYFTGISESTSKVSNTYRIKAIYANGEGGFYAEKYYTNGSDFAEYFEWLDGNPNNEDRCGLLVALEGECIRPANADDECIGAITGSASYIGNAYDSEWQGKYLTDVYGRPLTKEVQVPAQVDAITGEVVQAAYTTQEYVINPEYNPMTPYVSRTERREWAVVGLTGQIVVRDDGTCVVGSHLAPLSNGIGTISDKGYKVMKRIDANHVKILIK